MSDNEPTGKLDDVILAIEKRRLERLLAAVKTPKTTTTTLRKSNGILDEDTKKSFQALIDYLRNSEEDHYREQDAAGKKNHVWRHALVVEKWLKWIARMP